MGVLVNLSLFSKGVGGGNLTPKPLQSLPCLFSIFATGKRLSYLGLGNREFISPITLQVIYTEAGQKGFLRSVPVKCAMTKQWQKQESGAFLGNSLMPLLISKKQW